MKSIILLCLISLYLCLGPQGWEHYKTCDPKWGNDRLWIDDVQGKDYTFCNDEQSGRNPTFFNAKLMTLTAAGLNSKNINCGELGQCTPATVNNLIKAHGKDGFMKLTGVASADGLAKNIDVRDYLDTHILLNSYVNAGSTFWFIVTGILGPQLTGINHNGVEIFVRISSIKEYMGWRVVNTWPHFPTCGGTWAYDPLYNDKETGKDYSFCNDEVTGRNPTFFNAKLMTLTAIGMNKRLVNCGSHGICNPGKINTLIQEVGKQGFMKATGVVSADGTSKDINPLDYLNDHILLNSYLDNEGVAFFFIVTGMKDKDTIMGINHEGKDVLVSKSVIDDYMGWKFTTTQTLKFLEK